MLWRIKSSSAGKEKTRRMIAVGVIGLSQLTTFNFWEAKLILHTKDGSFSKQGKIATLIN